MTIADLMALLPAIEQFLPEIKTLIDVLKGTDEQDHQKIMQRIDEAFNEAKNSGRPGPL